MEPVVRGVHVRAMRSALITCLLKPQLIIARVKNGEGSFRLTLQLIIARILYRMNKRDPKQPKQPMIAVMFMVNYDHMRTHALECAQGKRQYIT